LEPVVSLAGSNESGTTIKAIMKDPKSMSVINNWKDL